MNYEYAVRQMRYATNPDFSGFCVFSLVNVNTCGAANLRFKQSGKERVSSNISSLFEH